MQSHDRPPLGVTIIELITVLACCAVLGVTACIALGADGHGTRTRQLTSRDATKLREIHQTFIICSREYDGHFIRPGLIDRLPIDVGGQVQNIPGRGEEDVTQNTTAHLYAVMIVMNYFTSELCVSPVERNPHVAVDDDFDYDRYNPAEDVYWDADFGADLETGSNVSYAHLVMFGERSTREWRETFKADAPVFGNRGPLGGELDGRSYTCGPHGHWTGNIVFNDNHTECLDAMTHDSVKRTVTNDAGETSSVPDNIFAMESGPSGADVILSFTRSMTAEGPTLQHD